VKLSIVKIEKALGKKLRRNYKTLGMDIASKTGWAYLTTNEQDILIDYGTISAGHSEPYFRLRTLNKHFEDLIHDDLNMIIIESAFFGMNKKTYGLLSMFQGLAVSSICKKNLEFKFIYPSSARAHIGLCGNAKKEDVHKELKEKTGISLDNEDATDAVVLGLNGLLIEEEQIKPKPLFKKKGKNVGHK